MRRWRIAAGSGSMSSFAELGDLFNVGDLNERLADLATVLIPAR